MDVIGWHIGEPYLACELQDSTFFVVEWIVKIRSKAPFAVACAPQEIIVSEMFQMCFKCFFTSWTCSRDAFQTWHTFYCLKTIYMLRTYVVDAFDKR